MVTIIYGDDNVETVRYLSGVLTDNKNRETIRLDGIKITITDCLQAFESRSFFNDEKTIIIENLFKRLKSKEKDEIIKYIAKTDFPSDLYLFEYQVITPANLKLFPKAKIIKNLIPQLIFKFLDNLGIMRSYELLAYFKEILRSKEAEFVHSMLYRQYRYLIIAKDMGKDGLTDMSPWQAGKFLNQAKYFSMEKLISSYRQILLIDYKIKSGQTPFKMEELLDIFLADN